MFNPNFIEIYDNALTPYQCKEVIQWVETQSLTRGRCAGDNNEAVVNLKVKNSWDSCNKFSNKNFVDLIIRKVLNKYTPFYLETYPSVNLMESWDVDDHYNIQKYEPLPW